MGRKGIVEELGTAIGIKFTMCHFAAKCRGARVPPQAYKGWLSCWVPVITATLSSFCEPKAYLANDLQVNWKLGGCSVHFDKICPF